MKLSIRNRLARAAVISVLLLNCRGQLRIPAEYKDALKTVTVTHNEIERKNLIYVPQKTKHGKLPVLLMIHGGGGTPENMAGLDRGRILELADSYGFAVVYPEGKGKRWNDLREDDFSEAHKSDRDDTGYILKLIQELAAAYPVDPDTVMAGGISNGGMMSLRLACEVPGIIDGIVAVTANLPERPDGLNCKANATVNITIINGTEDPLVPYEGGYVTVLGRKHGRVISTADTFAFWKDRNKCTGEKQEPFQNDPSIDDTEVMHYTATGCQKGDVTLYKIKGGGHTWPGGVPYLPGFLVGKVSNQIDAGEIIKDEMMKLSR